MTAFISSALDSRTVKSGPKSLAAKPPFVPVSVSSTLSSIGCEKFQKTPGNFETSRFMAAINSALSLRKTGRH